MHKTNCMQSIEHISTGKYLVAYVLKKLAPVVESFEHAWPYNN